MVSDGSSEIFTDCNIEICDICPKLNRRSSLRALYLEVTHDLRYDSAERDPNAADYNYEQERQAARAGL